MWRLFLTLLTALSVAALPAANDYGDCSRDDLYKSLQRDGQAFCTMILDPECYTTISTPTEFATYPAYKLSSYCSCIYEPCHHDATSSEDTTLPSYTQPSSATVTSHTLTSVSTSDSLPTHTPPSGPPWSATNTTRPTATTSTSLYNETVTVIPVPTTLPTTPTVSTTVLPGNTTSTQVSNSTSPTSSPVEITSVTVLPGNATSTEVSNTTSSQTIITSATVLPGNTTSAPVFNTTSLTSSVTGITSATVLPGNITSSQVSDTSSTTASATLTVTTSPANNTSTQVSSTTSPTVTPTPFPASNFTGVLRGPAPATQACHHRPEAEEGPALVAALQNEDIRHRNLSLAFPYVGSVAFDSDGITPLYLSVRDAAKGSHLIDVSDASAVTIFDSRNNSMRIDMTGIHFVTGNCNLTVSYLIDNMYTQLAQQSLEMCSRGPKTLLATEQTFTQTLFLRDQCNEPVGPTVRQYPDLRLDDEQCFSVGPPGNGNGTWVFNCPWESAGSSVQRCMSSLQRNAVDFLLYDPFNGGCADVSSVVTLLDAYAQDLLNTTAIQQELYNQVGNGTTTKFYKVEDTVMYYMQLWESLKSTLSKTRGLNPGRGSNLKQYLDTYNSYRNFAADACASLNGSNTPAVLNLSAGSSTLPMLAAFDDFPVATSPLTARIQNPAKVACCPNGGIAVTNPENGICAYPPAALVPGTNCVCGKTASQQSVAFSYRQCDNFVSQCEVDSDCANAGYAGYLCLIGSCCGKGVCFDPFECSRPDVLLLPGSV